MTKSTRKFRGSTIDSTKKFTIDCLSKWATDRRKTRAAITTGIRKMIHWADWRTDSVRWRFPKAVIRNFGSGEAILRLNYLWSPKPMPNWAETTTGSISARWLVACWPNDAILRPIGSTWRYNFEPRAMWRFWIIFEPRGLGCRAWLVSRRPEPSWGRACVYVPDCWYGDGDPEKWILKNVEIGFFNDFLKNMYWFCDFNDQKSKSIL